MRPSTLVVTGSIAHDHLMDFPGRFREQLIDGQLDHISLSFLVDELRIFRGGVGANVAFGLALLGHRPHLVGAVGADFADYRRWLEGHGVDTAHVRVSTERHTARFQCTTDRDQNQIASFYAGAMAEAREIDLREILASLGRVDLVMVSPDDPDAMLRHTSACRERGVAFAADPSQQLARMSGAEVRQLVEGAQLLFTNEYERDLLLHKTGWSEEEVLVRVASWVVTLGENGLDVLHAERPAVHVDAHAGLRVAEPTGVGDALRAGYLAALVCGLDVDDAGRAGATSASFVIEVVGTQEHTFTPAEFLARAAASYGEEAAHRLAPLFADTVAPVAARGELVR